MNKLTNKGNGQILNQNVVINEDGHATNDFRVESNNGTHALFVDAGADVVHINQSEAAVTTQIHNDNDVAITVSATEVVINDDSHANIDFRVESDGEDEAIFLDSSANTLYINKGETAFTTQIANDNDTVFTVDSAGATVNPDENHAINFRVASNASPTAIFVSSSIDMVLFHSGSEFGDSEFPRGVATFFSGSIGDNGPAAKDINSTRLYGVVYPGDSNGNKANLGGLTVFSGDLVVSGGIYNANHVRVDKAGYDESGTFSTPPSATATNTIAIGNDAQATAAGAFALGVDSCTLLKKTPGYNTVSE